MYSHPLEHGRTYQGPHSQENSLSLSLPSSSFPSHPISNNQLSAALQLGMGTWEPLPALFENADWVDLVQATTDSVSSGLQGSCQSTLFCPNFCLAGGDGTQISHLWLFPFSNAGELTVSIPRLLMGPMSQIWPWVMFHLAYLGFIFMMLVKEVKCSILKTGKFHIRSNFWLLVEILKYLATKGYISILVSISAQHSFYPALLHYYNCS